MNLSRVSSFLNKRKHSKFRTRTYFKPSSLSSLLPSLNSIIILSYFFIPFLLILILDVATQAILKFFVAVVFLFIYMLAEYSIF